MNRYDIYWAALDPTIGTEIQKTRPCVIISPDEMNQFAPRVIVAPITSTLQNWPFRLTVSQGGQKRDILLDQIRTLDKRRLHRRIGELAKTDSKALSDLLVRLFAE
jgi:mRNA interferase MazF